MADRNNPLQRQLEDERFRHAIEVVHQEAQSQKNLNSSELAHLNQVLTKNAEPWRVEATQIQRPGGEVFDINMISNPVARAREIMGKTWDLVAADKAVEAAIYAYTQLVLDHLFKDANRRTAALAALWVLNSQHIELDAYELIKVPVGNLRSAEEREAFAARFREKVQSSS